MRFSFIHVSKIKSVKYGLGSRNGCSRSKSQVPVQVQVFKPHQLRYQKKERNFLFYFLYSPSPSLHLGIIIRTHIICFCVALPTRLLNLLRSLVFFVVTHNPNAKRFPSHCANYSHRLHSPRSPGMAFPPPTS